jgi:hypothetical protein
MPNLAQVLNRASRFIGRLWSPCPQRAVRSATHRIGSIPLRAQANVARAWLIGSTTECYFNKEMGGPSPC